MILPVTIISLVTFTLSVMLTLPPNVDNPITSRLARDPSPPLVIVKPPMVAVVPVATRFPFVTLNPPAEKYIPELVILPTAVNLFTFVSPITCSVLVCTLLLAVMLPARKLPPMSAMPVVKILPIKPMPPCTLIAPVVVLVL